MIVSPAWNRCASSSTVASVAAPLGTMTQAARGGRSASAKASRVVAGVAPSSASLRDVLRVQVEDDALVPPAHQAADHVRTHPAQTDHAELHDCPSFRPDGSLNDAATAAENTGVVREISRVYRPAPGP